MEKPYQELVAFRKTSLLPPKAGECVLVRFPLAALASYSSKDAAWELEEGDYLIRVGNSSRNTQPVAVLRMKQSKKTSQLKNLFDEDDTLTKLAETETGKNALAKRNDRVKKETAIRTNQRNQNVLLIPFASSGDI
ncbi:MAG: fibronectin type III-like domain-contianing protein [Lachnospiraceae bacterium]